MFCTAFCGYTLTTHLHVQTVGGSTTRVNAGLSWCSFVCHRRSRRYCWRHSPTRFSSCSLLLSWRSGGELLSISGQRWPKRHNFNAVLGRNIANRSRSRDWNRKQWTDVRRVESVIGNSLYSYVPWNNGEFNVILLITCIIVYLFANVNIICGIEGYEINYGMRYTYEYLWQGWTLETSQRGLVFGLMESSYLSRRGGSNEVSMSHGIDYCGSTLLSVTLNRDRAVRIGNRKRSYAPPLLYMKALFMYIYNVFMLVTLYIK